MRIPTSSAWRRAAAPLPAFVLGAVAVLAQRTFAEGDCFRPTLELFSQSSPGASSTTGKATVSLTFKPPFVVEGAANAHGFLDMDSGAVGALGASGVSRFWTPTCPDWSYGWLAKGTVVGAMKTKTSKATNGSAVATCSFAASAAGDLDPAASDAKTAQSSTSGGSSVSIAVGVSSGESGYEVGFTTGTATVTPSTNAAGDANALYKGPQVNIGAGGETIVVVNLYAYVNAQANGSIGGWAPHVSKSSGSAGGYAGAAIEQALFAVSPSGFGFGLGVHPQSRMWRDYSGGSATAPWTPGPWRPPFIYGGPDVEEVDEPPLPPDRDGRTPNDGKFHKY